MRVHIMICAVAGACVALACGGGSGDTDTDSAITGASGLTNSASASASTSASPSAGATSGGSGSDASAGSTTSDTDEGTSSGAPKLDVGAPDTDDSGTPGEGCQKVDFLFVVDNSISMGDEQNNLANSFPSFIQTIQSEVQADDYHIMIIDTDDQDKWGEKWDKCHDKCMTDDPGDSCLTVWFDDIICGMEPPAPEACDQTLGAGRNKGAGGPPIDCMVEGGARYMSESHPQLDATFECVANMGATGNSDERPMAAMLAALGPQTAPGGCHPGFLRDDAVLVLTFISDEEELGSPGTPTSWRDELLALKGGNETAVVVLALSGDTEIMGQECTPTPKMTEFVGFFGQRGIIESVCEPDYGPFFQDAVGVIDYACDNFEPPE